MSRLNCFVLVAAMAWLLAAPHLAAAAPRISPDWGGSEPSFPPGSLYFRTDEYKVCPVVFRTIIEVRDSPVAAAAMRVLGSEYTYVFLNGQEVRSRLEEGAPGPAQDVAVELTHLLQPGSNVLAVSTATGGLSLEGGIRYEDGERQGFGTEHEGWKVQKLPPLTVLEDLPAMRPEADVSDWFPVLESGGPSARLADGELDSLCERLAASRLARWDADADWRLHMLATKGIAVVNWEAHGCGGAGRIPEWVRILASEPEAPGMPGGTRYARAESLCRYVVLCDEATNLRNLAVGFEELEPGSADASACRTGAAAMDELLSRVQSALRERDWDEARKLADDAEAESARTRSGRLLNELNWCLDNKFAWFDSGALLDNNVAGWGLEIASPIEAFASPLSPATLLTLTGTELVLQGWETRGPYRVYDQPPKLGPVGMWAVLNAQPTNLQPHPNGVVYDRAVQGPLTENWGLLVEAMDRGGRLPVELVFLQPPSRVVFEPGETGTARVRLTFDQPRAQMLILRPLKEWRGFLEEARRLTASPLNQADVRPYVETCRLWSRALLQYPVSFSEAFITEPDDPGALLVADVYNYRQLEDAWGTPALRIAPLPPLASYGLLKDYPGLRVISDARILGSRGVWGDEIAAVGQDHILYRVPLDHMERVGGFTSYRHWPTEIDVPGTVTEIEAAKRAGATSFRLQHNKTGDPAMQVLDWCWERGIQTVFNPDEKWIPDIVEYFRTLAAECEDYPPQAVAYDLLNEPETRVPRSYNAVIRKISKAIREIDQRHPIYVEAIPEWGPEGSPFPEAALENLAETGDPLTCYSFHDYKYRLPERWPNDDADVRDLLSRWIPAFKLGIDYRAPVHLGEFGGFEQTDQDCHENACAITLMMDYLRVFDQFGWHWHYYIDPFLTDRNLLRPRRDGSLQESYVHEAVRRYFDRGTLNALH